MSMRNRLTRIEATPVARGIMFVIGIVLLLIAPVIGALPGPGGIFVLAAGLTLVLRASRTTKKLYARLARRWPGHVGYVNWGLRRRSHLRRVQRARKTGADAN